MMEPIDRSLLQSFNTGPKASGESDIGRFGISSQRNRSFRKTDDSGKLEDILHPKSSPRSTFMKEGTSGFDDKIKGTRSRSQSPSIISPTADKRTTEVVRSPARSTENLATDPFSNDRLKDTNFRSQSPSTTADKRAVGLLRSPAHSTENIATDRFSNDKINSSTFRSEPPATVSSAAADRRTTELLRSPAHITENFVAGAPSSNNGLSNTYQNTAEVIDSQHEGSQLSNQAAGLIQKPRISDPERERSSKQVRISSNDNEWDVDSRLSFEQRRFEGDDMSSGQRSKLESEERVLKTKGRPKSSSLWEKIKRREQREKELRERGLFEHAQPDFVDLTYEPNYCGDRDTTSNGYPPKRTLYYSKKGTDASYIDVVAEVQGDDDVDVRSYGEPTERNGKVSYRHERTSVSAGSMLHRQFEEPINTTRMMRQAVFDEWLARKSALVRSEQKKREALRREEAHLQEDDFRNKVLTSKAAFIQWKKGKGALLKEKEEQKRKVKEKEVEDAKNKEIIKLQIKTYSKAWVTANETPKTDEDRNRQELERNKKAEAEKKAIERRRKAKEEKKQRAEEERKKKELGKAAYQKWHDEKQELAKQQFIEKQKQLKSNKEVDFNRRLEKDHLAVDSYEQWLERKEKQLFEDRQMRRLRSAGSMGRLSSRSGDFSDERPPWFPASHTVASRSNRK